MTAVQAIAVVLIRLWAVGHVIAWSFSLFQTLGMMSSGVEQFYRGAYGYLQVATFALILAFWSLILCYSRTVTAWILPPVKEADHRIRIAPEDLISVGTFIVGVYYLTDYVPNLLRSAPVVAMEYVHGPGGWGLSSGRLIDLGASIVAILIALWLVLRPNHLVRLFTWLRRAGVPKEGAAQEEAPKAN